MADLIDLLAEVAPDYEPDFGARRGTVRFIPTPDQHDQAEAA